MTETLHEEAQHITFCANHPETETSLRCNRCEKSICSKCAVLTPTGYRCNECIKGQQRVFDTAQTVDYVIAIGLAGILSFIGSLIIPNLGFFTIFLAPGAGIIIAESIRRAIRRRRSKRLFQWTAAAVALGSLLPVLGSLTFFALALLAGEGMRGLGFFGFNLLWQGVYTFMATSTVYYRLSGLKI
jgi:hypothetical protein